jgi:MFS transporter, FLVCR family, feline leukemia virus subgroup C receptor-related protein
VTPLRNSINPSAWKRANTNFYFLLPPIDPEKLRYVAIMPVKTAAEEHYVVTKYRYLVLIFFMACSIFISCTSASLTPVAPAIAKAYGINTSVVEYTTLVFSLTYAPMTFAAVYMYENLPPALCLRIGALNILLGAWVRIYKLGDKFWPVLLGYGWISFSYPIFLSATTLVINSWFND